MSDGPRLTFLGKAVHFALHCRVRLAERYLLFSYHWSSSKASCRHGPANTRSQSGNRRGRDRRGLWTEKQRWLEWALSEFQENGFW